MCYTNLVATLITSSAASATSGLAAGIGVAGALVAVSLFVAILARECVLSEDADPRRRRTVNAVVFPLAVAFVLNLVVHAVQGV
jgi:4-hydroxybenzoate polyprenyltransferase